MGGNNMKKFIDYLKLDEAVNSDLKLWEVSIRNNYYAGKYYEVGVRPYPVLAKDENEAKKVVLKYADEILKDIANKKMSGKNLLAKDSTLPINDKNILRVEDGSKKLKRGTMGKFTSLFSINGKVEAKLENGVPVEIK